MKKLLILGTNSNIGYREIIEYCKQAGIHTTITDWNDPEKSPLKKITDSYWMISTSDIDALEEKCRQKGIDGVFGATDYAVDVALELTSRLGIPYYCDKDVWHYSRDKVDFKKKCRQYGVPVAASYDIKTVEEAQAATDVAFPVITKPADRSGNVGFSLCTNHDELVAGVEKALHYSEGGQILVEEYLTGHEYSCFYALANGEARLLSFWSMLSEPGQPTHCYSFSTTVCDKQDAYMKDVHPNVVKLFKELGYRDGVAWIEFMANEAGKLHALEVGHRLSGEKLWIPLTDTTGFNSLQWMVDYAVNGKNDPSKLPAEDSLYVNDLAAGYILWTSEEATVGSISGFDQIAARKGCSAHLLVKPGCHIDGHQYAAIITFSSTDLDGLRETLHFINNTASITNEEGSDILIRYTDEELLEKMYATMTFNVPTKA